MRCSPGKLGIAHRVLVGSARGLARCFWRHESRTLESLRTHVSLLSLQMAHWRFSYVTALGRPRSNSHRQGLQPLLRLAYNSFSAQARTTSASSFSFVASASSDATIGRTSRSANKVESPDYLRRRTVAIASSGTGETRRTVAEDRSS